MQILFMIPLSLVFYVIVTADSPKTYLFAQDFTSLNYTKHAVKKHRL